MEDTIMKFEFCNKKKTNDLTADVVLVAAAAGALAAGCVIAAYEALKSEKGQAAVAKTKAATITAAGKVKGATVAAAGKVKETATTAAGKVKATATSAVDAVKAKLPKKAEACECECAEEVVEAVEAVEEAVETVEA
jgi:hypothetical protein